MIDSVFSWPPGWGVPVGRVIFWPPLLSESVAARAHAHRERAWRNGRGRSKSARRRLARHMEKCPWC